MYNKKVSNKKLQYINAKLVSSVYILVTNFKNNKLI